MRADLDAAMANVRLGAEQKAAILAAAKGAGELSRKRRSIRTVMAVAALCSVLAATALAASPTLRETLEEMLGGFASYSRAVEGAAVTEQGIQVTVLQAVGDDEEGWCYLEIRDLTGDRLTADTHLGSWIQAKTYDPETRTLLARADLRGCRHNEDGTVTLTIEEIWGGEAFSGIVLPGELLEPGNVLQSCQAPAGPETFEGDDTTALVPNQTPMALEGTDLFSLSSAGFDEDGKLHIQIEPAEGTEVPKWAFYPLSLLTADLPCTLRSGQSNELEDGRYVDFRMDCYTDMDGETVLPKEAYRAAGDVILEGWIGTRERVEGEWSLTFPIEPLARRTVAVGQQINGLTADTMILSALNLRVEGTFTEQSHGSLGSQSATLFLKDGSIISIPRGRIVEIDSSSGPGERSFTNVWPFVDPVEPEKVVGVAIGYWYIQLEGNTALPGRWLTELPNP